ncbi:MAG: hypothetical protein ACOCZR_05075 [Halanaerobiales bacterium]
MSISQLLKFCHQYKNENNLSYQEAADDLMAVAKHYRWYGGRSLMSRLKDH